MINQVFSIYLFYTLVRNRLVLKIINKNIPIVVNKDPFFLVREISLVWNSLLKFGILREIHRLVIRRKSLFELYTNWVTWL